MSSINGSYDVIVVGAGMGGLTCGALLAKRGRSVLIVEQSSKPGGCCTSFEHEGFTFDYGVDSLKGCEEGGAIYQTLEDLGSRDEIELIKVEPAKRIIGGDYDIKIFSSESFEDRLVEIFPMDSDDLHKFMKKCRRVARGMDKMNQETSPDLRSTWQEIWFWLRFFFGYGKYKEYRQTSSGEVVAAMLDEPKLRAIVQSVAPHFEPGTMANLLMWALSSNEGTYYPRGGMQALAQLLAEGLTKRDGVLALNTTVNQILIEGDRATGVELADGRQVRSQYVISNAAARQTFLKLIGEANLTPDFVKDLDESQVTSAPFLVSLGIDLDLETRGFDAAGIVYNPSNKVEELFGTDPEDCLIRITMHSLRDSTQAPTSMSTVQLMAMLPYDYAEDWEAAKESIADKLIASAERIIPELKGHIVCKHVLTPLSHEHNTMNSRGALMGWYPAPDSKERGQNTPFRNLYQAGHWTFPFFPGGGVAAAVASGRNAVELVLKGTS